MDFGKYKRQMLVIAVKNATADAYSTLQARNRKK
jgi:hypothetical protein